jgi:hypothetical protein
MGLSKERPKAPTALPARPFSPDPSFQFRNLAVPESLMPLEATKGTSALNTRCGAEASCAGTLKD